MSEHLINAAKSENAAGQRAGPTVYKNVKAYWEQEIRLGAFLPAFTSKFVNERVITQIKNKELLSIRQEQVVFRVCMTPPKKLVLVQKLEHYLKTFGLKSGIELEKGNFPDKEWLILAISTLSSGKDEIFEPSYVPTRDTFGLRPSQIENLPPNVP
jgi:hypothetical protein